MKCYFSSGLLQCHLISFVWKSYYTSHVEINLYHAIRALIFISYWVVSYFFFNFRKDNGKLFSVYND